MLAADSHTDGAVLRYAAYWAHSTSLAHRPRYMLSHAQPRTRQQADATAPTHHGNRHESSTVSSPVCNAPPRTSTKGNTQWWSKTFRTLMPTEGLPLGGGLQPTCPQGAHTARPLTSSRHETKKQSSPTRTVPPDAHNSSAKSLA